MNKALEFTLAVAFLTVAACDRAPSSDSFLSLPPSEPHDPPGFWDEVMEFRGTLGQNGRISGEWTCAPFYTRGDDKHYVVGTWRTTPQ